MSTLTIVGAGLSRSADPAASEIISMPAGSRVNLSGVAVTGRVGGRMPHFCNVEFTALAGPKVPSSFSILSGVAKKAFGLPTAPALYWTRLKRCLGY